MPPESEGAIPDMAMKKHGKIKAQIPHVEHGSEKEIIFQFAFRKGCVLPVILLFLALCYSSVSCSFFCAG
jgi:hypothetical protein